jgi:hypothetical protein
MSGQIRQISWWSWDKHDTSKQSSWVLWMSRNRTEWKFCKSFSVVCSENFGASFCGCWRRWSTENFHHYSFLRGKFLRESDGELKEEFQPARVNRKVNEAQATTEFDETGLKIQLEPPNQLKRELWEHFSSFELCTFKCLNDRQQTRVRQKQWAVEGFLLSSVVS